MHPTAALALQRNTDVPEPACWSQTLKDSGSPNILRQPRGAGEQVGGGNWEGIKGTTYRQRHPAWLEDGLQSQKGNQSGCRCPQGPSDDTEDKPT